MSVVAIIPARKGSIRLRNKNRKILKGVPLINWSINTAKNLKFLDDIIITTDDKKILSKGEKLNLIIARKLHDKGLKSILISQNELIKTLNNRIDNLSRDLNLTMRDNNSKTSESLGELKKHMDKIDEAQKNISDLSSEMITLQDILSNKQTRGVFGEIQLNEIITNIDVEKEKKFLIFLNPKLKNLSNTRINEISKKSLINRTIKKIELEKYFDLKVEISKLINSN